MLHGEVSAAVVPDHRNDGMIRYAPLPWTVIVEDVTKPRLALLHERSRKTAGWEESAMGESILAELNGRVQPLPNIGQPGLDRPRRRRLGRRLGSY